MARSDYAAPTFIDVPNPTSPPGNAVPLDAAHVNAMAQAIANSAAVGQANVFTGNQRINGGFSVGATSDPKQPVNVTVAMDGGTVRASGSQLDKVANQVNAYITGSFSGDTGSNAGFLWGQNVYLTTGATSGDGAGLSSIIGSLIEANVSTPAGTTFPLIRGLHAQAAFAGASAGATVTQMESLRVSAPVRKDGATAGTATNVYGLFVETVDGTAVGATGSAFSLFVNGGTSRFGGQVHVSGTVNNTTTDKLSVRAGFSDTDGAVLELHNNSDNGNATLILSKAGSSFFVYDSQLVRFPFQITKTVSSNQTSLSLLYNNGTADQVQQVTVGAADSGGTGRRMLTVPN